MKITDRLIGDHKTFLKMGRELDDISNLPASKRDHKKLVRVVELFKDHLVIHAWFEDNFYYPAVRAGLSANPMPPLNATYMDHLDHEHKTVDGYLDQLETEIKSSPIVYTWPQTFSLFFHGLKSHMRREEEELFPLSEKLLGEERLHALSDEMETQRTKAPAIRVHARLDA
jgi:hemerythrin-like domain-containing protein